MSLSKEHLPVGDSEHLRKPKCTRCRHHGIIIPQKGHVRFCPFVECGCCKCFLVTQRTRLTALQRSRKNASNQPQRKQQRPAVSQVELAAEGTRSTGAREDDAGLSAAFGAQDPPRDGVPGRAAATGPRDGVPGRAAATGPRDGVPGRAAATGPSSLDIQSRAAAGRPTSAGWDGGKLVPFGFSDEEPGARFRAPYLGELGQAAALPVIHVPWMPGFPGGYGPCPNLLLNVPWALYNNGLRGAGPLMLPRFEPAALRYPPPPEPAADCRPVFFALRPSFEAPREEVMSWRHAPAPPWEHTELDVEELD
ncbi:doublesex- and mab-3-related transcription factor B1-like [Pseudoliparis swirei]|uniref:doublesex- and mab-3-related transcription factor B1-like n=1 Tax=Pseudoliparis swirei TaxID=2059687 RepID=UPI0024BE31A0|nr:doublesex- and mab-3-related transcription factor B1-like [Pseudoliparis swirei]